MRRIAPILLVLIALGLVLADPDVIWWNHSHLVVLEPTWQVVLWIADLLLLGSVLVAAWRGSVVLARRMALLEALFCVGNALLLLRTTGIQHFVVGLGAEETLSPYLVGIACRFVLLSLFSVPGKAAAEG